MNRSRQSSGTRPENVVVQPHGDRAGLAQRGRAVLADHLAADVVAVADVDAGLDVDQRAAAGLEDQQQRILELPAVAVLPRLEHRRGDDLLAEHPARHVDVVHGGVGDRHLPGVMARDAGVAVRAVHHQRSTDVAAVDHGLERPVGGVVPAHVADLDQPPAEGDLGVDDPAAGLLRGGQRLLAEDRLAGLDRGEDVLLVRRTPGADEDRVDIVGVDQFLTGRVGRRAGNPVGDPLGLVEIDIGDRDDRGPGENRCQPADVVLADHADADDSDVDCHVCFLL